MNHLNKDITSQYITALFWSETFICSIKKKVRLLYGTNERKKYFADPKLMQETVQFKETDNVFWCFLKYWDTVETVRVCGKQYREFIGYVFNLFMFL